MGAGLLSIVAALASVVPLRKRAASGLEAHLAPGNHGL